MESSHTLPCTSLYRPCWKKYTLHIPTERNFIFLLTPLRRGNIVSLPSNNPSNENCHKSPNEKSPKPRTEALFQWTFILESLFQVPPFLNRSKPPPLFCTLDLLMVYHSLHVLYFNPFMFLNKIILLVS